MLKAIKDKYYWTQLRAALTAGQWSDPFPAKAPNGTPLSWSELFRKFNKHCIGYQDITEVASQTQALALLLSANSNDDDQDDPGILSEFPLELGDECLLPEERIDEASAGYDVLKELESSNFDTLNFALAYYAYALGSPSECLSHLNKVLDDSYVQTHILAPGTTGPSPSTLQTPSARIEPSTSSSSGTFVSFSSLESSAFVAEIKDGRAWAMIETLRSLCLQGMSHEKLFPDDPQRALKMYCAALPLLTTVTTDFAFIGAPTSAGKIDFISFTQFRELWRWVERLIWRAIILSARTSNIHKETNRDEGSLWTWLGHYGSCSMYWPPNFRTSHRSTVSVLYLRAFILRYGHTPASPMADLGKPSSWLHKARSVVRDYRAILSVSTRFPRAGERNVKVEDFVDLSVALWEASGAIGDYAGWVIDILWWATRLTFNSYRILRHMTRLLDASGDTPLAKRTLRLYAQIVGKAWQANDAGVGTDADADRRWVETLVSGARMLCRSALSSTDGLGDAREAGLMVEKARSRLDKEDKALVASVDLAEGIWSSVMALKELDPHTRPSRLAHAHALFLRSVETFPTPSGYYHLAFSFTRPGSSQDLEQAVINAGLAIEGDPKEIRYWHLLGLLLTVTEKWKAAEEVLEQGAEIGEASAAEGEFTLVHDNSSTETDGQTVTVSDVNGVGGELHGKDRRRLNGHVNAGATDRLSPGDSEHAGLKPDPDPQYLLDRNATQIPPSSDLLRQTLDHPLPSRQDMFEYALQLRMTQVALTEYVEGAEGAADKWVTTFSWVHAKKETYGEQSMPSTEGGRSAGDVNLKSPSELVLSPQLTQEKPAHDERHPTSVQSSRTSHELPPPISITVSPATPEEPSKRSFIDQIHAEKDENDSVEDYMQPKRSYSIDRDTSKSKKVQQLLKTGVHKGQARISHISRKIGNGVARSGTLRRFNSTPDFHAVLRQHHYQASSIHSRKRLTSLIRPHDTTPIESPPPPPPTLPPLQQITRWNNRTTRENKLLSDLWSMAAATFRRLGKIEQAKGAIQEAEVRDENNPAVWVQLGLYYTALGHNHHAIDAFQKALFICPDHIAASVHLCQLWLSSAGTTPAKAQSGIEIDPENVDLAAGILSHLSKGAGWDVPEVWYCLAKAYCLQDRKDRERESLAFALRLSEYRGVRDIGTALGWCI